VVERSRHEYGAAISFYTVFSLAPMLLLVISVAGLVFGREASQDTVIEQMKGLIG
jgi:membrane protein